MYIFAFSCLEEQNYRVKDLINQYTYQKYISNKKGKKIYFATMRHYNRLSTLSQKFMNVIKMKN